MSSSFVLIALLVVSVIVSVSAQFNVSFIGNSWTLAQGFAIDSRYNIFIADEHQRLYKLSPRGDVVGIFGSGQLNAPRGIAVDSADNVYVSDLFNNRVVKFDNAGRFIAAFSAPTQTNDVAVSSNGDIFYVSHSDNTVKRMRPDGSGLAVFASGFAIPQALSVDRQDNVYVADRNHNVVKKFTVSGALVSTSSFISQPYGVTIDRTGSVFVASGNRTITRLDSNLNNPVVIVSQVFTTGTPFLSPLGMSTDASGDIYAGSGQCQNSGANGCVYQLTSNGRLLNVFGPPPTLSSPIATAVDTAGNLYILQSTSVIKLDQSSRILATFTTATPPLNNPSAISVDAFNTVYVTDRANNRIVKFYQRSTDSAVTQYSEAHIVAL